MMIAARWERSPVNLKMFMLAGWGDTHGREDNADVPGSVKRQQILFTLSARLCEGGPPVQLGGKPGCGSVQDWKYGESAGRRGRGRAGNTCRGLDWTVFWLTAGKDPPTTSSKKRGTENLSPVGPACVRKDWVGPVPQQLAWLLILTFPVVQEVVRSLVQWLVEVQWLTFVFL